MKAVLFSIGTRGDIEPFLAVAQLLNARNWEVLCVFPEQFRELVEEMSIPFKGFGKEFIELLEGKEAKMFMGGEGSVFKRFRILVKMSGAGIKLSKEIIQQQRRTQVEEKPDRIIYHPKCNYALLWGMAHPGQSILLSPIPFLGHPVNHLTPLGNNYGKILNRFSFWFVNTVKAVVIKMFSRQERKEYQGMNITVSSIKKAMLEKEKTLYSISPSLFPRPDYWPAPAKVVGYYERNKMVNWQPEAALTRFLEEHSKIIFITFGSMTSPQPGEKSRIIVEVLKRNNIPAIINTSWGGLEETSDRPGNIYFVPAIPYDWIFSKMYAAVHHGGSGTTHSALKYGCPSLVIPHILDQFFWNRTIAGMQLGPDGIPIKNLDEATFERKLLDLLNNPVYKTNALLLSEKMKAESDPDKLYDLIVH